MSDFDKYNELMLKQLKEQDRQERDQERAMQIGSNLIDLIREIIKDEIEERSENDS